MVCRASIEGTNARLDDRAGDLSLAGRALTRKIAKTEARLDEKVDSLLRKVDEISAKMNRQRDFWGWCYVCCVDYRVRAVAGMAVSCFLFVIETCTTLTLLVTM